MLAVYRISVKHIKIYPDDFKKLYNNTDPEILSLEGISPDKLNINSMANRYFNENTADMSIDDNANFNAGKSYGNYLAEVTKGWLKLQGYYDLYKLLKKRFGEEHANNILQSIWNGDIYMHDSTAIQIPYCWAYSTAFSVIPASLK